MNPSTPPKFPGVEVEIGDTTFVVPPLTLGQLKRMAPILEKLGKNDNAAPPLEQLDDITHLIGEALRRNYPELTDEELLEMLEIKTVSDITEKVMNVSGLLPKGGNGLPRVESP